jgi:hypothetical protein
MARSFPTHFLPDSFGGPRAEQCPNREDAFQQLVGDGLRAEWGGNVFVAPTKGRDGGIDAFVTGSADASASVHGVPMPAVIECKDHDDQLPRFVFNITAGWSAVEKKLLEQANNGWPGLYRPWRTAHGYVYCVSAVLPSEQMRQELVARIETFFESLPADRRPPIEKVQVVGWAAIRDWLDRIPRVVDRWLGVGLPALAAHEEYVRSLQGFRELLLDDRLSFVAPVPQASYHPDRVLEHAIALANQKGVLLIGPGGVGKTRTLMEVATRANASGWRVLHALPGEPALTTEELADVVLQGYDPTLVLIDYLDQVQFDLGSIRRRLFPEVQRRGGALALVADARPAFELRASADWSVLFDRVELRPSDSHSQRISLHVQSTVAPQAIRILGASRVAFLCGSRPIIALLIARELERRAHAGNLTPELVVDVRSGDLTAWLRRRLAEDDLVVMSSPSILQPAQPSDELIAAAAVLAAAPQTAEQLQNVAEQVLAATTALPNEASGSARGSFLIDVLCNLGWLEWRGRDLAVAHDLVADEVLEQALSTSPTGRIRRKVLHRVLNASLKAPRTLGRYAITLARLIMHAESTRQGDDEDSLREAASEWFKDAAEALGQGLLAADSEESSYALGAVLAGPPWADAMGGCWQEVAQPWLERHQADKEARHLLYRGLRILNGAPANALLNAASAWLSTNGATFEARFVLSSILNRDELDVETGQKAIGYALSWLATNGGTLESQFVLGSVLERDDLDVEAAQKAIAHALGWLETNGATLGASYVIRPLLNRDKLDVENAQKAVTYALSWLETNGTTPEAQFVLSSVLDRDDLDVGTAQKAITHALRWLSMNGTMPEANTNGATLDTQFVLSAILNRDELDAQTAQQAIAYALSWLATNDATFDAQFVLSAVLKCDALDVEAVQKAIAYALTWLATNGATFEASFVLRTLLDRDELNAQTAQQAIAYALSWLATNGATPEAQFILSSVLERDDLDVEAAQEAIACALSWFATRGATHEARFVLRMLLNRDELDGEAGEKAVTHALSWLAANGATLEAQFVLSSILNRDELNAQTAQQAIAYALSWLATNGAALEARFVLSSVLNRDDLDVETAQKAVAHALYWLSNDGHSTTATADYVIRGILGRQDLAVESARSTIDYAQEWLRAADHCSRPDADYLIGWLLARPDLDRATQARATEKALSWLEAHAARPEASFLLRRCLKLRYLADDQVDRLAHVMYAWTIAHSDHPDMNYVVNAFLRQPRTSHLVPHVLALALTWLRAHSTRYDRDFTIKSLLMNWRILGSNDLQYVVAEAIAWLRERRRATQPAASLLQHLNDATSDTTSASWRNEVAALAGQYGITLNDQKATKPFRELTADLDLWASSGGQGVSLEVLRGALETTTRRAQSGWGASASWALPALLTLTARSGDTGLFEATKALAASVVPTLTESQREGLILECQRLADAGAWPDIVIGRNTLKSLGLQ